jgi:DNA-binding transcriptional ArsR family regulator
MPTIQQEKAVPGRDYEAEDVLVVDKPEQLRALADDLRATMIALLRERARSTQELAEQLELPKGTVGHHLKVLERAGLIRVVRTRKVRALTEKYYGRVAWLFLIHSSDAPEAARPMAAALRRAANELEVIEGGPDVCTSGVLRVRLTPEDARRFERRLEKLVRDMLAADTPRGREFVFPHAYFPKRVDA